MMRPLHLAALQRMRRAFDSPFSWQEGSVIPEVLRSGNYGSFIGYAGRTFGSATPVLGFSLPLARGV